jgi:hypothetical protein
MLADTTRADEKEKAAIVLFDEFQVNCARNTSEFMGRYLGQDYVAAHSRIFTQAQQNRLALYQGAITFGEYASRSSALVAEGRTVFAELDRRRQQMAVQKQAADAASMGAAAQMLQATRPAYQPMTLSPTVNCTSVNQGIYTNTTCR